jgi:hypothetical protein
VGVPTSSSTVLVVWRRCPPGPLGEPGGLHRAACELSPRVSPGPFAPGHASRLRPGRFRALLMP